MLRVGHQNVYHLYNKVPDLCVFLSQSTPNYNIFGITESRLDSRISDQDINLPNYCISRKDSIAIGQTGITYTTLLLTLPTGVKTLKVTLLTAFGLN